MHKDDPQRELRAFIDFALRARDAIGGMIRRSAPNSTERYRLHEQIFPPVVRDTTQTRLARTIAEARRNGELDLLAPRLEALDKALRVYAYAFLDHRQGNTSPFEQADLNDAISALIPFVESRKSRGAATDNKGTKKASRTHKSEGPLTVRVAMELRKNADLTSMQLGKIVGSPPGSVRNTAAWNNRKQLRSAPSKPAKGRTTANGQVECEASAATTDHYTVLQLWQERKQKGESMPRVSEVAAKLGSETTLKQAKQIIAEAESIFGPYADL